jgi:DNA repair protein RadC
LSGSDKRVIGVVAMNDTAAPPDHSGHRARLRARLLEAGGAALSDYELVEYLLSLAIPRRDTKPLAKALLKEFGSLAELVSADPESLLRVKGMGETSVAALKIVQATSLRLLKGRVTERPILASWSALLDWLRADMGPIPHERVRVLHLDSRNQLLRDEVMSEGTVDQSAIYVREVAKRALELSSSAVILVHNHPSGTTEPSRQDIHMTREVAGALEKLGIALHDHIIIGGGEHYSFRGAGLL